MAESILDLALDADGFALRAEVAWDARAAVLFGPSGAGKTTLLEAILGQRRGRGRVVLAGEVLQDDARGLRVPVQARRLGWVPQDPTLMPHLSVRGNLALGRRRAGAEGERLLARAVEVLEIGALLDRGVEHLSGGERQRVALARALASGPRALLLDEPLAALDVPLRARVLPYLLRVRDELGLPMITITHDPDEAQLLGEFVAVLDGGRVVASGPVREVLWSRAVRPLSEALGLENLIEGVVRGGDADFRVETPGGVALVVPGQLSPGERVRLGLRAEDVLLALEPPGRISARNVIPGRVLECEQLGSDALVHLAVGRPEAREQLVARVTASAASALELRPGREVHAVIKAWALRRLA